MITWFKSHAGIFLVVIFLAVLFLLYLLIDAKVTVDHAQQEIKHQHETIQLLRSLLQKSGKQLTRMEIKRIIQEYPKQEFVIKEDGNKIVIDGIVFVFDNESLNSIKFIDEIE